MASGEGPGGGPGNAPRRAPAATSWHDDRERAARRHRRSVLRAHHPDLGGDPAEFIRQVALLQPRASAPQSDAVTFVHRPRGFGALAHQARVLGRRSGARLRRRVSRGGLRRRVAGWLKQRRRAGRLRTR